MLNPSLVQEFIVPDLGELSPNEGDADDRVTIDPGQLQITCTWLYQKALNRRPPIIDEVLYLKEAGGANGIMVRYMEEELKTRFAGKSELARQVLVGMAAPEMERWVQPESLTIPTISPELDLISEIEAILNQFVESELLVRRFKNDRYQYAFVNQMIYEEAVRLGGKIIEQQYNARDEVERVWRLWLAAQTKLTAQGDTDQVLATRQQLKTLAESGQFIDTRLVKLLLLLRSAVLHGEPTETWLRLLREKEKQEGLIHAVEHVPASIDAPIRVTGSAGEYVSRLLGMNKLPEFSQKPTYGEITRTAVFGKKALDRQTAVLTLCLLDQGDKKITQRLEPALQDIPSAWSRFWRRSELLGTLVDAAFHPDTPSEYKGIGIYLWRVGRRAILNRQHLIWSAVGTGLGAGLGLGFERLLIGSLAQSNTGVIFFALFSYWGFLLGGLTALASASSRIFLLETVAQDKNQKQIFHPRRTELSVLLGIVGFGAAKSLNCGTEWDFPPTSSLDDSIWVCCRVGDQPCFFFRLPKKPSTHNNLPSGRGLVCSDPVCFSGLSQYRQRVIHCTFQCLFSGGI